MKKWYSAKELAGLPGMPKTASAVIRKAKRESYFVRIGTGRGRGKEYHISSLPEETRDAMALAESNMPVAATTEIVKQEDIGLDLNSLKKWQRDIMEARLVLFREFERLRDLYGTVKAADKLATMAKTGILPEHLQRMVTRANARHGRKRQLSKSTILGWQRSYTRYGIAGLAPKPARSLKVPDWAPYFHKVYNRPQKPSIPEAMRELEHILPADIAMPSYHQLRRYHQSRSRLEREKGRHSSNALKRFRGYIRRSTDNLQPMDVVQCDGHSFKAKIAHPAHGKPYKPEVCAVIDVKTKMCLGWSTGLAESAYTVADALRHAMTVNDKKPWGGVPAILYTDNGAGNMAHIINDQVTGILARAGITHHTGNPGNAQGRGLVEKTNQRLWISAARKLATFVGKGMDELEQRRIYLMMEKEVRDTGTCLLKELPSWSVFLEFCEQSVRDYNNTPHSGLGKMRDSATGRIRHMTPAEAWFTAIREGWNPTLLDPAILEDLYRPQEIRKAIRSQVSLHNNLYYEAALEHYHGKKVIVEYDIHDPSTVRIRDMEQRLICLAHLDRNKKDFFPKSEIEMAREKRYKGRKKLLERRLEEVESERTGMPVLEMDVDADLIVHADPGAMERQLAKKQARPITMIEVPKQKPDQEPERIEAQQKVKRIFSTKAERFDAILSAVRAENRPLTTEEAEFLDEYYQEDGGRMYMQLVGDLRVEFGIEETRNIAEN